MVEWKKEEDQIHTLPCCVKVTGTLRTLKQIDTAFLVDEGSVLHPVWRETSWDKTSHPQLRVRRKWGLFLPLLTPEVQATSSKWKSHSPNASYHLSNTFSFSQEASYATIYITSATDFLVVEYRWNKTLFYNKHSKILHRISTVYNPERVTLNKTILTNVSAANQCPIMSTVS